MLIAQIEIYDQIWYVRNMPREGKHSAETMSLVKDFVFLLENIPDGCAECYPEMFQELMKAHYEKEKKLRRFYEEYGRLVFMKNNCH